MNLEHLSDEETMNRQIEEANRICGELVKRWRKAWDAIPDDTALPSSVASALDLALKMADAIERLSPAPKDGEER